MEFQSQVGLVDGVTRQELRDLERLMSARIEVVEAKAEARLQHELLTLTNRIAWMVVVAMGLLTGLVIAGTQP